jgi:hypothetical protein
VAPSLRGLFLLISSICYFSSSVILNLFNISSAKAIVAWLVADWDTTKASSGSRFSVCGDNWAISSLILEISEFASK